MEERNPFAPPKANLLDVREAKCTRDGKFVVVPVGNDLPARCIVCNEPASQPVKPRKVYWHNPWIYLLILVNLVVYLIVGVIARKKFEVSPGLCEAHESSRKGRTWALVGGGFGAMVLSVVAGAHDQSGMALLLIALALVLFVVAALVSRRVYAKKITKEYARLGGCKEPFLASLEGYQP